MGVEISRELHWFLETMQEKFGIIVDAAAIGIEAIELGLDEVEDFFVPEEVLEELPETLLYEIIIYDGDLYNDWVGGIAFHPNRPEWCLQVITLNDEVVFRKTLPLIADD
ncbi:hypothetical protein GN156_07280 [bacterium LRH843]|nr:hypothetical protein [bacterium LRH843]